MKAIECIGEENVFIVCMDGACKAVLKRIGTHYKKIFTQRCSTHGCSLLMKDIGKQFEWELTWCMRLIQFFCNHDGIFALFLKYDDAKNLFAPCDLPLIFTLLTGLLTTNWHFRDFFIRQSFRKFLIGLLLCKTR